jgi:hypothetical protein
MSEFEQLIQSVADEALMVWLIESDVPLPFPHDINVQETLMRVVFEAALSFADKMGNR